MMYKSVKEMMSGQLTLLEHPPHMTKSYIDSVLPADRKAHKNSC